MENEKELLVAIEHLKARNMSAKHIDMAITALEKQIPKKPTNYTKEYDDLLNMGYIQRYCDCGQKIDWNFVN